ncbi:MAG: hypothetical protein V1870_05805 [Candidatus Aenigmatarchaeota archaeon]
MRKFLICLLIILIIVSIVYAAPTQCCAGNKQICKDGSAPKTYAILIAGPEDPADQYAETRDKWDERYFENIIHIEDQLKKMKIPNLIGFRIAYDRNMPKASEYHIRKVLNMLQRISRECDTVMFFFKGHADQSGLHLGTEFTELRTGVKEEFVSIGAVELFKFSRITKGRKIFVIDSCGSGAFIETLSGPGAIHPLNTIAIGSTFGSEGYIPYESTLIHKDYIWRYVDAMKDTCDFKKAHETVKQGNFIDPGIKGRFFSTGNTDTEIRCNCK